MIRKQTLTGMVEVTLTSANFWEIISALNRQGIVVRSIECSDELTGRFVIRRSDIAALSALCRKTGSNFQSGKHLGLSWSAEHLLRRPVLLLSIVLFIFLCVFLPTRVLFVKVDGNSDVPSHRILEAGEQAGIRFGASRRFVRSETIKNQVINFLPDLQWVGVNTKGVTAVISVRERAKPQAGICSDFCSIIASTDGVILNCGAEKGKLLCQPGQAVREGEILISPYTDCGISIRAESAEGEIFALTTKELNLIAPAPSPMEADKKSSAEVFSILIGKKRIFLWKGSRIWDSSCGRMYGEKYVTLPGGFRLPLAAVRETVTRYQPAAISLPENTSALLDYADAYILQQMTAGKILQKDVSLTEEDGTIYLSIKYQCSEMIGQHRQEQIGAFYGETD